MVLNPFQVRLKDDQNPLGYRTGIVGTVVGMVPVQQEHGIQEIYKVLWYNFDEESGDMTVNADAPAPSSHFPQELVAHVDDFDDLEDEDDDELETEFDEGVDNPDQIELPAKTS